MRILTSADISNTLLTLTPTNFTRLQDAMTVALQTFSAPQDSSSSSSPSNGIHQPARTIISTPAATTLTMPVSTASATSVKTVFVAPSAPPAGAVTVFSPTGTLLGVLSAEILTAFRTALVSCAVLRASPWAATAPSGDSGQRQGRRRNVLVVFGGGRQAEWHVRLVLRTIDVGRVVVVCRSAKRGARVESEWVGDLRGQFSGAGATAEEEAVQFEVLVEEGNESYQDQLAQVLEESNVVCGTTPSTSPLFPARYLGIGVEGKQSTGRGRGKFISLIGSYKPEMQEVDEATLLSGVDGIVIVDSVEDCLVEAGELIKARRTKEQLIEAGEIFAAKTETKTKGRDVIEPAGGENVVFKCVGMGLMDLTVAKEVLDIAQEAGMGTVVDGF